MEDLLIKKLQEYNISVKKSDIEGILNPKFDNCLIIDDYEILIEPTFPNDEFESYKINYDIKVDKIPKFKGIKFGCELETYFIRDCRKEGFDGSFKLEPFTDDKYYNLLEKADEIYLNLIRENIIPYLTPNFLKKFPYAYITNGDGKGDGNFIFIDLASGEIIKRTKEIDAYKHIAFVVDGTLTSGDYVNLIPCEIVSPVLDNIDDLKILYEGLINTKCNFSDDTAGFHVNISTIDENGYPIKLTRGMLTEIVKSWMVYEKKNIKNLRNLNKNITQIPYEYSFGNSLIYEYNNNINHKILSVFIKNKNGKELNKNDIKPYYKLSTWMITKKFLAVDKTRKFLSIHLKNQSLLEFRAFPSKNDTLTLLEYTKDVINIITKIMNDYCNKNKSIETILNLQKNYLNYEFNYSLNHRSLLIKADVNIFSKYLES
jgi:hypothetical protein